MHLGIQTYSIRHFLSRDPSHGFSATKGADFLEIAGAADNTLVEFSAAHREQRLLPTGSGPAPVLGAHIAPIDIGNLNEGTDLIDMHLAAFETLEWVVFFLNPNDLEQIEASVQKRTEIYKKYAYRLNDYQRYIITKYPNRTVRVLYHTYPHDFLITTDGSSCIEYMRQYIHTPLRHERFLQLDVFFSAMVGACALEIVSTIGGSLHSIHINSWLRDGNQAELGRGCVGRQTWVRLLQSCREQKIGYGVIEHDIDPGTAYHVMRSLEYLRQL
jgi:hypothetical protein